MFYLDQTQAQPAADLELDDALLDRAEHHDEEWLRFWEPKEECVVLGRGNRPETEVNLPACQQAGIPVLRRSSGGGTVLIGPGCLCYTVVLPLANQSELQTPAGANRWILQRVRRAIRPLLPDELVIAGDSDLTLANRKVAGHAQRRKRAALMLQGVFLLNFDLPRINRFLRTPSRAPDYRAGRSHEQFVANLHLPPQPVRESLIAEWQARPAEVSIE